MKKSIYNKIATNSTNLKEDDIFSFCLGINEEVEKLFDKNLPDPNLLKYYNELSNREIFINDTIDECIVEFTKQIIDWNADDNKLNLTTEDRMPIRIYINTLGGSLTAIWSLIDAILISKTPVYTYDLACAYSAGGMLLIAGHKRYCLPHASFMVHDGAMQLSGNTGKLLDNLEFTKATELQVKNYFLQQTKITSEEYDFNYRKDWSMLAEEMLKLHIVDEVISDISTIK